MNHNVLVSSKKLFKAFVVLTFLTLPVTGLQAQDPAIVQPEQESKWKKAGEEIKEAAGAVGDASKESFDKAKEGSASAWDKTKKGSSDLWEKTKEESEEAWEKTKEESEEAWDKTKEGSKKAWDKTKETTTEGYDAAKQKIHEMTAPDDPVDVPKEPLTPPATVE